METYDLEEAKAQLASLLERVADGEEIVLARSGRPVARLVRVTQEPRKPGRLKGRIRIAPDFEEPIPEEILATFKETAEEGT